MQRPSEASRWWDWAAIAFLFIVVELTASRLVATTWTESLYLVQTAASIGFTVGVILGYSIFSMRASRWISFLYILLILPMQWTLLIDQKASLEEQIASTAGRLFYSFADFFSRRPVEDNIFFISLASLGMWLIASSAGFQLVRNQKFLNAVLPSAVVLLTIQHYDNAIEGRAWFIAVFTFILLLLLGRLTFLANRRSWRERRVFVSPDNNMDLATNLTIAAGLLIFMAWAPPASLSGFNAAEKMWNRFTRPLREVMQRMENAISALEGTAGGKAGEFYGPELLLGQGFDFSDTVMFTVQTPDVKSAFRPPRYYWRGRTYDRFENGQWYTTDALLTEYSPDTPLPFEEKPLFEPQRFVMSLGDGGFSLLYAPSQPVWVSRQGSILNFNADNNPEVVTWYASPALQGGETYQVDAVLSNPNTLQLREAGTNYPTWIINKYLQLPAGFSPRIKEFALELATGTETPYDTSVAITRYLRNNIEYVDTLPRPPRNQDPLEWMLFENKQAYCVYYASAEVLMLRSLGIPARLAVGFAQGEQDGRTYTVRRENAHAWPEIYFPGIGWVEFEPTGGQPSLNRPAPPTLQPSNAPNPQNPDDLAGLEENTTDIPERLADENLSPAETTSTLDPRRFLILFLLFFVALTIYLSRRYSISISTRMPAALRYSFERIGTQPPAWILNWERWASLSPIERAYESINFSLQLLGHPMPMDATPGERARSLGTLLPKMEKEIITLLDEHQTYLYTSRQADTALTRRVARKIRWHAIFERARYILEGTPVNHP